MDLDFLAFSRNINQYNYTRCSQFFYYLNIFTRIVGIFTAIVVFGVGMDIFLHRHEFGLIVIFISIFVGFFEATWIITLFFLMCIHDEYSPVFYYWKRLLWFENWKKSTVYLIFSIFLVLFPHHLWLSNVAGILLVVLASFHGLLTFEEKYCTKSHTLLNDDSSNADESSPTWFRRFNAPYDKHNFLATSADNLSALDQDGILEL